MTALSLSLPALAHNLSVLRSRLNNSTQIIGVVKANAYGLGSIPIAKKLVEEGASYLAVAYTAEGIALRKAGLHCPIMVFYPQPDHFNALIQHCLEPVLYNRYSFEKFSQCLKQQQIPSYPIHLKFNTGLNRIGFTEGECSWLLNELPKTPFELRSVYSHLAASEEAVPHQPTQKQFEAFQKVKSQFENQYPTAFFHILNTSGVFNYPKYQLDAVRVGIGLYGFANQPQWDEQLKAVATLTAKIIQIHNLKKGETVGYNQAWTAPKPSRIATLPLGHADGIGRQFGHGKGQVRIQEKYAPIVGHVCMDMLMIDVSNIACEEGDTAVLFDNKSPLQNWAETGQTIPYEFLTGLSQRIPRLIVY